MASVSSTHGVSFIQDSAALSATITTDRLHMRSVLPSDLPDYTSLFGDPKVMEKTIAGKIKTPDEVCICINDWVKSWQEKDPFSSLAVFEKDTGDFLGTVVLEHGNAPGKAELTYFFMKHHWGKHYGREAVTAILHEYAPAAAKEGYTIRDKILCKITATVRHDNPASAIVIQTAGMFVNTATEKIENGILRTTYFRDIERASD